MRRFLLSALFGLLSFVTILTPSGEETTASHVDPILFVHGYTSNAATWNTTISRFQADGWESNRLFAYTFSSTKSNALIA
jgi:triacylglycerol lipase